MKWPVEKKIAGGFGLLLTILIIIGVISVQSALKLIETSRLETKSRFIVKKLAIVLTEITAAETWQCGYIITGDERYLEPYHAAVANIDHEVEELRKLIRDNPDHQRKLDALKPLLAEKLKGLKEGIDLRKNKGFEATAKEVRSGKGRLAMNKIQKIITEIEDDEREFLKQRSTKAEASTNRTIFIIIFGSSLAFVIVGLASFKTHRELTRRKQIENLLRIKEWALEYSITGIGITDLQGYLTYANNAFFKMWGYDEKEVLGKHILEFCQIEDEVTQVMQELQDEGWMGEIKARRKDGSLFDVLFSASMIKDEAGNSICMMASFIDITDRKRYEESLIKTTEELKRLDQLKSDFISTASHELRTPLASIKNAVDLILSKKAGEITDTQEKFLSMAQRNVNRLSALINDLLDISRIESGKIQLNYTEVDIKNIIENVINTLRSLANEKSISLKMNLAPDLPPIYADAFRLEQVLINLVNNAIKFTPDRGSIVVDVHQVDGVSDMSEDLKGFLELAVTDTGIGIPEEHVRHLFEKFYQVESSLSVKRQTGTGLGLAISKGIVKALGGKIQCKSKEGVGSTFSFTLPIIATEKRFSYMLKNELAKARQYHLPLSVLIIKLEDFAQVKEVYEIKECERVLELVKEKIEKKGLKFTDKINVSRYNGEIIALIIMPDTSCNGAQVARERIKTYLTGIEIAVGESKYSCSFVSGVATYPDDGISAEELLDFAMERLEKKG